MSKRKVAADQRPAVMQLERELSRVRYQERYWKVLGSTVLTMVALAILVFMIVMVFPVFRVSSNNMDDTLQCGDIVVTMRGSHVGVGDMIAFQYGSGKVLIKRVIALEGDTINIETDGSVYVNGSLLTEIYVSENALGECDITMPYKVPSSQYFVMGDNRLESLDSRSSLIGCVAEEQIISEVALKIWPLQEFELYPVW